MKPNKLDHEFFINLEPNTGIPLEVRAAMQLNLLIQPISHITMFKKVKKTFVPMLWFSQTARLTQQLGDKAKVLLTVPAIVSYTGYAVIGIAVLLVFITACVKLKKAWPTTEEERLLNGNA